MYKVLFTVLFISQSLFADYSVGTPFGENFSDRFFYTLAPEVQLEGPVLDVANHSEQNKQKYTQNIFGYIIKRANHLFKSQNEYLNFKHFGSGKINFESFKYEPNSSVNYSYYTFLVTALSVFQHESKLNHLRKVTPDRCVQEKNDLTYASKSTHRYHRYSLQVQESTFRNPYKVNAPDCSFFNSLSEANQVLTSTNHEDFGIGQLNMYWHPLVISENYAFNVYHNIDYALDYLLEGYTMVRSTIESAKYDSEYLDQFKKCNFWNHPFSGQTSTEKPFYNLVRATWAGTYNHGDPSNPKKVCRFATANQHDIQFKQSLDSIVLHEDSLFHKHLPENSIERKALNEITHNFKNIFLAGKQNEVNDALQSVTNKSYKKIHPSIANHPEDSLESNYESTHFLITQSYANFRMIKPETDETKVCGQVEQIASTQDTSLKVVGTYTNYKNKDFEGDSWYAVVFPKYAPFVNYNDDPECLDESKNIYTEDGSKIFMIHSSLLIPIETKVKHKGVLSKKITTMNIYKHHSYNSGIVDIIIQKRNNNNGHIEVEILNIIERNNTPQWYYIKTSTYNYGWIPAKYIEEVINL